MSAKHPKCRPPRGVRALYRRRDGRWVKDDGKPHEAFIAGGVERDPTKPSSEWEEFGEVYSVKGCTCSPYLACPIAKAMSAAAERWGAALLVIRPKVA